MSLKEKIENNVTLIVLGLLLTGFLGGFATHKALETFAPATKFIAAPSEDKSQGSPYVHWWSVVTDLPLQQCEGLTREVYRLTGTAQIEDPERDESSFAQVGVFESVASVIVCVRTGEKTTVMVVSSGPDQTITKNRLALLRDVVKKELPR